MVQPQNWGGGHTHDAHTSQDPPRAGKGGQWGWGRGLQGVCHTPPPQPCPHTGSVPSPTGGGLSCPVCPPPPRRTLTLSTWGRTCPRGCRSRTWTSGSGGRPGGKAAAATRPSTARAAPPQRPRSVSRYPQIAWRGSGEHKRPLTSAPPPPPPSRPPSPPSPRPSDRTGTAAGPAPAPAPAAAPPPPPGSGNPGAPTPGPATDAPPPGWRLGPAPGPPPPPARCRARFRARPHSRAAAAATGRPRGACREPGGEGTRQKNSAALRPGGLERGTPGRRSTRGVLWGGGGMEGLRGWGAAASEAPPWNPRAPREPQSPSTEPQGSPKPPLEPQRPSQGTPQPPREPLSPLHGAPEQPREPPKSIPPQSPRHPHTHLHTPPLRAGVQGGPPVGGHPWGRGCPRGRGCSRSAAAAGTPAPPRTAPTGGGRRFGLGRSPHPQGVPRPMGGVPAP